MNRFRMIVTLAWAMFAALALSGAQAAPLSLVADTVTTDGRILTARGNVSVFAGDLRLGAQAITYDSRSERLSIIGPILITAPDGSVLEAKAAELSPGLQQGLLESARLVLRERLQLVAATVLRQGDVTGLRDVAATSCQVCAGQTPLWQIRAREVIHDASAKRLWFKGATLQVKSVPFLWIPELSLPEPGVTRARGWLRPEFASTSAYGAGVALPYFLPLGATRDLTLTPRITQRAQALGLRYRQGLRDGLLSATGTLLRDHDAKLRGQLGFEMTARLSHDVQMSADALWVSDDTYLRDVEGDTRDQIANRFEVLRIHPRALSQLRLTSYRGLHSSLNDATRPTVLGKALHSQRWQALGGMATVTLSHDSHLRRADTARDSARTGISARWSGTQILGPGLELRGSAGVGVDHFSYAQSAAPDGTRQRADLATSLGWPLIRTGGGWTQTLEPRVTLSWAAVRGAAPINDDSTRVAWDETSLHHATHLPGEDAAPKGARAAFGLNWTALHHNGTEVELSLGRLAQQTPISAAPSTGLAGTRSDWLIAGGIATASGFDLRTRHLIDDAGTWHRGETSIAWQNDALRLSAGHVHLAADPAENRPARLSEITFDGAWQATNAWKFNAQGRYDLARDEAVSLALGAQWRNECVRLGLSASHRFATSANVTPSTNVGLVLSIEGFSPQMGGAAVASCRD